MGWASGRKETGESVLNEAASPVADGHHGAAAIPCAQSGPGLSVAVHVVIFTLREGDLQALLVHDPQLPPEKWAIPGGPLQPGELLRAAAVRTLWEQTGLADVFLEQLYTFDAPACLPETRMITVTYLAVVPAAKMSFPAADDRGRGGWWSLYALPPLAAGHAEILRYALTRLRYKLEYTAVGFELLPQEFTLTELQAAYEIVLGERLDKRNFRRKILSAGVIEPSGRYRMGEGRPARLYRYRADAVAEVKARRLFP